MHTQAMALLRVGQMYHRELQFPLSIKKLGRALDLFIELKDRPLEVCRYHHHYQHHHHYHHYQHHHHYHHHHHHRCRRYDHHYPNTHAPCPCPQAEALGSLALPYESLYDTRRAAELKEVRVMG